MVYFCHQSGVTIWKHWPVNALTADHIDFSIVFLTLFYRFFHTVYYNSSFHLVIRIFGNYYIHPFLQGLTLWKALQGLSAHNNNITLCRFTKELHICRDTYQQFIVFPYCPVFISCYDNVHLSCSPLSICVALQIILPPEYS